MEIKGTIIEIMDTVQVTDKFKKREFVVKTESEYPQEIILQLGQSKCDLIDNFKIGQDVTAHINIRGRKSGDRWWNTIECWKID